AIVHEDGQDYCFVVRPAVAGGTAIGPQRVRRTAVVVRPIPSHPTILQALGGVVEGDTVVTKGLQHLTEHSLVRIVD
ncbi:MAG: hypothetical protein ACE5E6_10280, partial [Phycisphaerae bacterium]